MRFNRILPLFFAVVLIFSISSFAAAEELQINWLEGPDIAVLGDNIATLDVPEGYIFAGPEDTVKIMEYYGNPPSDMEAGSLYPTAEGEDWFLVFEFDPVGYVRDDEKGELDADAIFESIRKGTEAGNKIREKNGHEKLFLKQWLERPYYDEETHNLSWALLAESESGNQSSNHNTRLLGRHGYMSITLVSGPEELGVVKAKAKDIISTFRYKEGKDYLSFVQGDKVAKYGLTALIAAGAGAAVAKTGLLAVLAKNFKAIIVAVFAGIAAFFRKIKGLFTGNRE